MKTEKRFKFKELTTDQDLNFKSNKLFSSVYTKRKTNYVLNNIIGFLIYVSAYFIFYYFNRNTFLLDNNYQSLFGLLIISLVVGSVLSGKFNLTVHHEISQTVRKLYISLIISLGLVSILLVAFDIKNIARSQLVGSMIIGFVIESLYYFFISEKRKKLSISQKVKVSFNYMLADVIILSFFCYLVIIRNIDSGSLNEKHLIIFGTIYVSWIFAAATTHKFNPVEIAQSKWNAFGLQLKFYLLIMSLIGLGVFILQLKPNLLIHFIEAVLLYSAFSFLLFIILYSEKIKNKSDEVTEIFLKSYEIKDPAISPVLQSNFSKYTFKPEETYESALKQKLQFDYLRDYSEVFSLLDRMLELKSFDYRKAFIFRSADPYNITVLPLISHQLIVNLHQLNDFRRINDYLRALNNRLIKGGVFVGALIPNVNRYRRFLKTYPYLLANILSFIDFIWKRIFPKLPLTRKIYFTFTRGKDRAISLAEGLGRLVYCGFEILDLTEINETIYFVAVKVKETSTEENPHYSPIFKMKRLGENGKKIYVYKLRTMHPYSEFIQELVFNRNRLDDGGKFKDDFRIPVWGRFFRKFWIDELPMLINWVKGDLKIVGVRPISRHYMSLYSEEHRKFRNKFKPGLIPPFYADMPKTISEIENSEKVYLEAYEKNPIKTDIVYFFKVFNNIVLRRKRSG